MADEFLANPDPGAQTPAPSPAVPEPTEEAGQDEEGGDIAADTEFRPCAFCGTSIHAKSHRCPDCGGHVGVAWGTVHKEVYLFLFSACLIAAGCLVSWDQNRPGTWNGLTTIRGSLMFAFALYGMFRAVISLFNRSMIVWPFFLNALLALWVGISGIMSCVNSKLWEKYANQEHHSLAGKFEDPLRAIPPGFWLITLAGFLVVLVVLKGVVAGFASGGKGGPAKDAKRRR